jgi:hypothetical protein
MRRRAGSIWTCDKWLCYQIASENKDAWKMSFFTEFWDYMRVRKKFWLLPVFMVMILLGGLLVLTKGTAVAPFIYTLF